MAKGDNQMGPARDDEDSQDSPTPASGGAPAAQVGSVDFANVKDVGLVNTLVTRHGKRWPVSELLKTRIVSAVSQALGSPDLDIDGVAKLGTLVVNMEKQNQADDHVDEKNDRLDAGKPTDTVQFIAGVDPNNV